MDTEDLRAALDEVDGWARRLAELRFGQRGEVPAPHNHSQSVDAVDVAITCEHCQQDLVAGDEGWLGDEAQRTCPTRNAAKPGAPEAERLHRPVVRVEVVEATVLEWLTGLVDRLQTEVRTQEMLALKALSEPPLRPDEPTKPMRRRGGHR